MMFLLLCCLWGLIGGVLLSLGLLYTNVLVTVLGAGIILFAASFFADFRPRP